MATILEAYYRLGDIPGSDTVQDSSGNGQTGSLLNGPGGKPTYGAAGVFLYDPDTALTIKTSGGFGTKDTSVQPPVQHEPLSTSTTWTAEMWFQWTGQTLPTPAFIPAQLATPITETAGFPEGAFAPAEAASVQIAAPYAAVGDLAVLGVILNGPNIVVTSVNGNCTGNWTLQVRNQDATAALCNDIWTAPVTSIAAADVLSITYSDSAGVGTYYYVDALTVGEGTGTVWSFPDVAVNQSNTNVTTAVYPNLNADGSGNPQAYWGLGSSGGTMSAVAGGSGFASTQISGSQLVTDLEIFSQGNPYGVSVTTGSGKFVTVGMIVEASIVTAASVAAVPNSTLMHVADFLDLESFSAYELQVGFVQAIVGGVSTTISNAIVEGFTGIDTFNVYQYPTNPFDGGWHHLVRCVEDDYPYLDGNSPSFSQINEIMGLSRVEGITFGTAPGINGVGLNPNIGTSNLNTNAQPFTGILDEVALYTGTLTLGQITAHYDTALWFQQQEYGASVGTSAASRLGKVLAVARLDPTAFLRVPYPWLTLLYAETNTTTTTSALNYTQTTSQSEPGIIFQGPDGYIRAYNREYQYKNPTSITSQALLSDNSNSQYFYDGPSLQIAGDDLDLWNRVQVQSGIPASSSKVGQAGTLQNWGPTQSTTLAQSSTTYGPRTLQGLTSLQMANDSDALAIAQWLAAIYHVPIERVTQVVLNSQGNGGANMVQMLQRGLWDRITVEYDGQSPGSPSFSQDALIEMVSHSANMDTPVWITTWSTSPYEILLSAFYADSSATDGTAVLIL